MTETMSCANCAFSEPIVTAQGPVLQCRRYPPEISYELEQVVDDPGVFQDAAEVAAFDAERQGLEVSAPPRWRTVTDDEWCGEWHPEGQVEDEPYPDEVDALPHNLIAHPLLVLCPLLGRYIHDRTSPTVIEGPVTDLWRLVAFAVVVAVLAFAVRGFVTAF